MPKIMVDVSMNVEIHWGHMCARATMDLLSMRMAMIAKKEAASMKYQPLMEQFHLQIIRITTQHAKTVYGISLLPLDTASNWFVENLWNK